MFDKNQTEFPSDAQYKIWRWGVHILPLDITLPAEVKNTLGDDLAGGCVQMRECLLEIMNDMYNRAEPISPSFILEFMIEMNLYGELEGYNIVYPLDIWEEKIAKKLTYRKDKKMDARVDMRKKALDIAGIKIENIDDRVVISSKKYPKMFLPMYKLAKLKLKEKNVDNCFTYCDFRYLDKNYKYNIYQNALVFLSDEGLQIIGLIDKYASRYGFKKKMSTKSFCKKYSLDYYYKDQLILRVSCGASSFDNHAAKVFLRFYSPYIVNNPQSNKDIFFDLLNQEPHEYKDLFFKHMQRCAACRTCKGGDVVDIVGKKSRICNYNGLSFTKHMELKDMPFIERMLDLRIKAIN